MSSRVVLVVHALQGSVDAVGLGGVQGGNKENCSKGLGSQIDTYLRSILSFLLMIPFIGGVAPQS